jgi:hypothetical protein
MKGKDFLKKVTTQGKINNEDFNKVLETFPDIEIPDVWVNMFDQEFLTRERALADPKVYDKIRAEQLDAVDAIIKDVVPFLTDKDKIEFQNESKTFNKLKFLKDAISRKVEEVKGDNPSNDEKVKELKKQNQEYVDKITALNKQWETTVSEKEKAFEEQKKVMQLDWTLDKKVAEYTFADEYKEVKTTLTKAIVDKIKAENVLILDQSTGQIQVHEKTESGVTKQKFINGSEPVTLDKLLEEPLKTFLKKNNKDGDVDNTTDRTKTPRRTTELNLDPSQMTLAQMRAAGVKR